LRMSLLLICSPLVYKTEGLRDLTEAIKWTHGYYENKSYTYVQLRVYTYTKKSEYNLY